MEFFIPKPYKKEAVTIRLDSRKIEQVDALAANLEGDLSVDALAARFSLSRSQLINQCVDFALSQYAEGEGRGAAFKPEEKDSE